MTDQQFDEYAESLDIAVIGMAGQFPGAADVDAYWRNIRDGKCAATFLSEEELRARGVDPDRAQDPLYVPAVYELADIDRFDAEFFGYSPREAETMDPQHRILLECAWAALERAGHDPARYDGLVGVYAGAGSNTYLMFNVAANRRAVGALGGSQVMIGNSADFLATRVSYKLGLQGPSVNVQSACSTSLVSVVLACQSLLSYQCDMALAGGIAADETKHRGYTYAEGGIFSPDGYCRSFDADAKGTVGGNGVGMVVLKRLGDAVADGDHIHAVIKGTALNNDGDHRAGFTAPGSDTQASVIATALANADVEPETIGYVETHGTATTLGDPIEFTALRTAFGTGDKRNYCALGAVKTNIGHLDAASGIAGLIKAVHAVEHGQIPPTLHFRRPNPRIDLDDSPFYVNTELVPWPATGGPRRAGVSSFGLGGTNAHVVLEQAPERPAPAATDDEQLLVLSARTDTALDTLTERLAGHLRAHPDAPLADVAFTLQTGRRAFVHRRVLVARDTADALAALDHPDDGRVLTGGADGGDRPVAFMFSGFGEQYPMMAERLYATEPAFRTVFDACAEILRPLLETDIRDVVFDRAARRPAQKDGKPDLRRMLSAPQLSDHPLDQPALGYPAVFAVEYALVALWRSWGVEPEMMIGHSLGEYVAACVAGVFTLEDALRLVVERARLITATGEGAMAAVPLGEEELSRHRLEGVSVAAVNDPRTCVLAGPVAAVERATAALAEAGVVSRRLNTRFAFHSPLMDIVVEPYAAIVRSVRLSPPTLPFVSNVTGTWITDEQATDPDYWARHVRLPVRFADGMRTLWDVDDVVLVEVGPGRALTSAAMQHPASAGAADRVVVPTLPDAFTAESDRVTALRALGRLWLAGLNPSWEALHPHGPRRRLALPTYPFARTRYWLDAGTPDAAPADAAERARMADWFHDVSWQRLTPVERTLDPSGHHWLVFADGTGLGTALAERLRALGAPVVTVTAGPHWSQDGPDRFVIDAAAPGDYDRLAEELRARGSFPDRLVHCWAVEEVPAPGDRAAVEHSLRRGVHSLVHWAQAGEAELMVGEQHWTVVTGGAHCVLGDETFQPVNATVQGVCKVAPQEYPALRCAQIDVPVPAQWGDAPHRLAERVLAELAAEADSGVVALRGTARWGQTLVPAPLAPAGKNALRPGGVYLVTGGLGRIGLVVARAIADQAPGARLVLLGRTGLPDRSRWDEEHPPAVGETIAAVAALEKAGATVMVCATDVAHPEGVTAAVQRAVEEFGPVNGVVHAAGTTGPAAHQVLAELDDAGWARHFGPKLHGVHVLERALAGQPLDFALLCSSVASLLGGLGFTAYAAANAFLDAYARREPPAGGVRWTSVNWEAWHFPDDAPTEPGIGAAVHHVAMSPDEGRQVFERVLGARQRPQVIVSTTDLDHRVRQWSTPVRDTGAARQRHARPSLRTDYVAPATELERGLAAIWEELLGIDTVGVQDNFFELGGSSLLGLQVVHRLRTHLKIAVPLTVVYEGPTIRSLARLIGELS